MNRSEKQQIINNMSELLKKSSSIVIGDFNGMTVEQADALRREFHKAGVTYQVIKNTLLMHAVKDTDMAQIEPFCKGPTAVGIGFDDPAAPARIFKKFIENNPEKLKVKGGFLSGSVLDEAGYKRLAEIPTFAELRSQLLGVIQAPAQKVASVLQARIDDSKEEKAE